MRLNQIGLDLLSYSEEKAKKSSGVGKVKTIDLIIMCVHLEQLDRAGVPLLESLSDVRDSTESMRLKSVMSEVYDSVQSGSLMSEAMARHPKVFDSIYIGLIAAAEKTGSLAESFKYLSDHMKWVTEIRRRVRKAVSYPAILFVMMCAVITVLMVFVVPKLVDFLTSQGFTLPIHTRALIWVSGFFVKYWFVVFGVPAIIIFLLYTLYRISENFAYNVDSFMLAIPVVGRSIRKIEMARFTHFFGVMFKSGIGILDCFDNSQKVVKNRVLKEAVALARKSITEGSNISEALRLSGQFPTLVVKMFKVGEESGNLNEAVANINYFYDREVQDAVDGLIGLMQPILIAVMGSIVFWVASSVFGPLYESISKMNF
jgi:type IV pilus assembly protein PilC